MLMRNTIKELLYEAFKEELIGLKNSELYARTILLGSDVSEIYFEKELTSGLLFETLGVHKVICKCMISSLSDKQIRAYEFFNNTSLVTPELEKIIIEKFIVYSDIKILKYKNIQMYSYELIIDTNNYAFEKNDKIYNLGNANTELKVDISSYNSKIVIHEISSRVYLNLVEHGLHVDYDISCFIRNNSETLDLLKKVYLCKISGTVKSCINFELHISSHKLNKLLDQFCNDVTPSPVILENGNKIEKRLKIKTDQPSVLYKNRKLFEKLRNYFVIVDIKK